jgi:excisionase family DNA binding protein
MISDMSTPLFNSQEAAAVLGVDVRTVQRWVREGRMRPAKTSRGSHIFTGDEIQRVSALPRRRARSVRPYRQRASS